MTRRELPRCCPGLAKPHGACGNSVTAAMSRQGSAPRPVHLSAPAPTSVTHRGSKTTARTVPLSAIRGGGSRLAGPTAARRTQFPPIPIHKEASVGPTPSGS